MKTLSIRRATAHDIAAITELVNQLGYHTEVEKVAKRMAKIEASEYYETLVSETGGKVVGFIGLCQCHAYEYDGDYVRIIAMAVSEQYRGQGIGTELLLAAEQWAEQKGAVSLAVNSGTKRERAHKFYTDHGYRVKGYSFFKSLNSKQ